MKRSRYGLYRRRGIFHHRWKDRNDKWHERSTGETDRKAAELDKDQFDKDNVDRPVPSAKRDLTVSEACTQFVEQHVNLKSAKARRNERSYLRQLLKHGSEIAKKRLKAITLDDLIEYQVRRSKMVAERPVNLELGILVNALKGAHLWRGDLRWDPIEKIGYRRLVEPVSEVGKALTEYELMRLEIVARSNDAWDVAYNAMVIAANTGVRAIELKKMTLGKIDLGSRSMQITKGKTRKSNRRVELNPAALAAVTRLYQRANALGASDAHHYLLPGDLSRHTRDGDALKGGRGFDPTTPQASWNTAWRKLRKVAGLPKLRFHTLRHTYVTRMCEIGIPLAVVKGAVGHMSDEMVDHYTHVSEGALRAANEKLQQFRESGRSEARHVDTSVDISNVVESNLLN